MDNRRVSEALNAAELPLWLLRLVWVGMFAWLLIPTLRPDAADMLPRDFFQEWASARNWRESLPIYTPQRVTVERYLGIRWVPEGPRADYFLEINAHPPTSVLLALPFGMLDYADAFVLWDVVSLAALVLTVWLVFRELGIARSPWLWLLLPMSCLACSPILENLYQGQLSLILLFLVTLAWVADRSGKSGWAGVMLAAATAIKLFPAFLFLYFLLRRRWRALAAGAVALVVLTGLTVVVLGPGCYVAYVHDALPEAARFRSGWANRSLPGLWSKLFDPAEMFLPGLVRPVLRSRALAVVGTAISCIGIVALLVPVVLRVQGREGLDRAFALSVVAMLLVSPLVWSHYLVLLLVPLVIFWLSLHRGGLARWGLLLGTVVLSLPPRFCWWIAHPRLPASCFHGLIASPLMTLTVLSVHFYILLALFGLGWLQTRSRPRP